MLGVNPTAYIRIPFQMDGDPSQLDRLKLRMKYDDGFVAYLNGQKIAEANCAQFAAMGLGGDRVASQLGGREVC